MKKKVFFIYIILVFILIMTGCKKEDKLYSDTQFKLNTYVTIKLYENGSDDILQGAMDLCDYYEGIFSRTKESSLVYKMNEAGSIADNDNKEDFEKLKELISTGIKYGDKTKGSLDISIEPISSMWSFGNDNQRKPSDKEIKDALTQVNYSKIKVNDNSIQLNGTRVDLGAVAKGYIADRIKDYLKEQGVTSATISLGGNILCLGAKPDNSDFKVGIQYPFGDSTEVITGLKINDMSVVTSGVYERYFYEDNVLYHHIINPSTGYPTDNNLLSVTIISPESVDGDALSTGCFVMGMDKAMELINSMDKVYAIFVDNNYELHYSEKAEDFILK